MTAAPDAPSPHVPSAEPLATHPAASGAGNTATLTISCPDQRGIVAAVSQFLHNHGANIIHSDQHSTDPHALESGGSTFFMRMEFHLGGLDQTGDAFAAAFARDVAGPLNMDWHLSYAARPKRMALLVSRYDHCFLDLLWRKRRGELNVEIPLVISNHEDLRRDAEMFGLPFHVVPVTRENKPRAEAEQVRLMREAGVDFAVLARYMQILSPDLCAALEGRVINIHHSFLPGFKGANPYRQAHARGVKLIGATAHFVTADLDEGPIIEQNVVRVDHSRSPKQLVEIGQDQESLTLTDAVQLFAEHRVFLDGARTVIFD